MNVADLVQDKQFKALELLKATPHSLIPDLQLVDLPVKINKGQAAQQLGPPVLGEQTTEILIELGYSDIEIEDLLSEGVIG